MIGCPIVPQSPDFVAPFLCLGSMAAVLGTCHHFELACLKLAHLGLILHGLEFLGQAWLKEVASELVRPEQERLRLVRLVLVNSGLVSFGQECSVQVCFELSKGFGSSIGSFSGSFSGIWGYFLLALSVDWAVKV